MRGNDSPTSVITIGIPFLVDNLVSYLPREICTHNSIFFPWSKPPRDIVGTDSFWIRNNLLEVNRIVIWVFAEVKINSPHSSMGVESCKSHCPRNLRAIVYLPGRPPGNFNPSI